MWPCRTPSASAAPTVRWSYAGSDRAPGVSVQATWSTKATPLAVVAEAVVLTLGVFSLVLTAERLALGEASWHPAATVILLLAACLVALRLYRRRLASPSSVSWCPRSRGFCVAGIPGVMALVHVWRGPGWVTLGLRHEATPGRVLQMVVWKSAIPAPLWSELVLRLETGLQRGSSHQNKENP